MKPIQIKTFIATAITTLFLGACSNVLEEEPRSIYTPEYFKTEKGVVGGLTSMYAHLRYIYGQGYYYNTTETGTDEATYAQSADANFKDMDLSGVGSITPSSSRTDALWQPAFININTASGIIENATAIGTVSNAMIAEARFFRAFDYFLLVQTFGGVPLDLGAGELKFNTSPSRFSVRNTVPQVYTKAIFPDLVTAVNDLPDAGRVKGGVTKTAARLYLAKAYLTYAWWLKNPNNIPTYPETTRVDPDGHDAAWYFQKAYDVAAAGIDSHGSFALQPTYYDVNLGSNDRNSEILLYADHTEKSEFYNASSLTFSNGNAPENFAVWMMTPNYTVIRSSGVSSVQREAVQSLGRPFIRMCPTIGAIANTFADKTNDSRYDGTFTTVYRGNWNKAGITTPTLNNANGLPVAPGGAILSFLNAENPAIVYAAGNGPEGGAVGAGVLAGRSDFVIAPSGISRIFYPGLWKLGTYRTDNGTGLGSPNGASTRPYNIAKFSELYLIAAEANVMGAAPQGGKSARELVNVLRARAGKWRFDNGGNVAKSADNSAAMTAATPAVIDINYILAERSREYFGEGYRWYDLIRTQKWTELSSSYQICGPAYGNHTPLTVARDIKAYHYLRPIPQVQFDAMIMTASEKAAYQNPGY
ncbi:RagB/SusD family nutrient uptake outer membrane protein [Flavobacterium zhairuonense]|uniref:RagB/SusD family nutrient uptake outer membrane protein n=1 Tax=Flavobacterium zhairuonense TaxID=2493631 RepID=UPI0010526462|nr:RagB/SusD family nutrient uptake outer membrane protein [Flavobacterium zhairuonense]KAF2509423.1 RagB/SusD family nutrient uptake outer membrane protein [Flavobacterium zhairuonense]